jgi:hypothetical protein
MPPLAAWVAERLAQDGVRRLLLDLPPEGAALARALPAGVAT